jgi:PPE-SVP subfamily C-terminal region
VRLGEATGRRWTVANVNLSMAARWHDFSSICVEAASPGTSALLGSLSVPPGWGTASTQIESHSLVDPAPPVTMSTRARLTLITGRTDIAPDRGAGIRNRLGGWDRTGACNIAFGFGKPEPRGCVGDHVVRHDDST